MVKLEFVCLLISVVSGFHENLELHLEISMIIRLSMKIL